MSTRTLLTVYNRRCVSVAAIPLLEVEEFASTIASSVGDGWRIVSLFGVPEDARTLRLCAVLANDDSGQLGATCAVVGQEYSAVSTSCRQAGRFEREIAEQCGAIPKGHPSLKPLRRHPPDHAPSAWTVRASSRAS